MTTEQKVKILSRITTRDESGRHFTELYNDVELGHLEAAGLLAINRPVHESGTPYGSDHYTVEVTPEGQDLVDANPEYHEAG